MAPGVGLNQGIGFNLTRRDAQEKIKKLGHNFDNILNGTETLTDEEIERLFTDDFEYCLSEARKLFENFDEINDPRQAVIIDLIFNMGSRKLSTFVKFCTAIRDKKWEEAGNELEDSDWYAQVGNRGPRDVAIIITGDFPNSDELLITNKATTYF